MSVILGKTLLSPYTSNYKNQKDKFVRVRGIALLFEAIHEESGSYMFPINWTNEHISVTVYDPTIFSGAERETFEVLEKLHIMWVKYLFRYEMDYHMLISFLGKVFLS